MIANVSLEKIGKTIQEADSILIFPHINPDGDAIGSACGLCDTLREHGKKAAVLLEEDAPEYLSFLDTSCCIQDAENFGRPDLCICVDCNDDGRLNKRKKTYQSCGAPFASIIIWQRRILQKKDSAITIISTAVKRRAPRSSTSCSRRWD